MRRRKTTTVSTPGGPRRCWGYARVSSIRQVQEGDSLEHQRRAIEGTALAQGYALAGIFTEAGVSASIPIAQRPQGAALLAAMQPGDIVVVTKLNRAFRSARDALTTLEYLRSRSIGLHSVDLGGDVTDAAISKLVFGIMSNVDEFIRDGIAERVAEAKADQRASGRHLGGSTQFGFQKVQRTDGKLYLEPVEAIHVEARTLKAQGYSARLAAGHFRGKGVPCTHQSVGKLWSAMGLEGQAA
jgi:DNA invertase Pin-like site-specific DNA recombinase